MNKFLAGIIQSFSTSVSRKKSIYIWCFLSIGLGIVVGAILSFTLENTDGFLSLSSKNYFSYLNGSAELSAIFFDMLGSVLLASIICLVLSLNVYSVIVPIVYVGYQSAIMILTIASVIAEFGIIGVVNSVLLIFPFNTLLLLSLALQISNMNSFCAYNKSSHRNLFDMRYDRFIFIRLLILSLVQLLTCIILSYFVPFMLKSLIIVSY